MLSAPLADPSVTTTFVTAFRQLGTTVLELLPTLAAAAGLLVLGWLVSWIVEIIARRILKRLGIDDRLPELAGTRATPSRAPSRLISKIVFWILMLTFVLAAAEVLGFETLTETLGRLVSYLPNVVAAGLLVLVGALVGRVVARLVSTAATSAGVQSAARLGAAARIGAIVLAVVLALGQLGVETRVLVTVVAVAMGGTFLTLGIAFGLGARPLVTHILAGHFLRKSLPPGQEVEVSGRRGTVERVGPVDTRFRADSGGWSVPNAQLLDEVIDVE